MRAALPTLPVAEVVQLGAANLTVAHDLELGDLRAVEREGALDADAQESLRTVKVSREEPPLMRMTSPWKTWMRSRSPSLMR